MLNTKGKMKQEQVVDLKEDREDETAAVISSERSEAREETLRGT